MNTSALLQKVWNFCHTLKDDSLPRFAGAAAE